MRFVAIVQLLVLMMSVLVDPVTHAVGFTSNHSREGFAAHFVDSYAHAEAAVPHNHDHAGKNDHTQSSQDSDSHQPGHCHLAVFIASTTAALDHPMPHGEHTVTRITSPVDRTLSPPTPPPLAV